MSLDRAYAELGIDPNAKEDPSVRTAEQMHEEAQRVRFAAFDVLLKEQGWTRDDLSRQPVASVASLLSQAGQPGVDPQWLGPHIAEYVAVSGLSRPR